MTAIKVWVMHPPLLVSDQVGPMLRFSGELGFLRLPGFTRCLLNYCRCALLIWRLALEMPL